MPKTINTDYEEVALSLLRPHPRNVNQGDFGAIQESVKANGFFGALVAQKSTGFILAGNHRYQVAKSEGFEKLPVTWVDVDDETALRILLADNRTGRLGSDDSAALAALLAELALTDKELIGTGYDGDDLDKLIGDLGRISPMGLDSTQGIHGIQGIDENNSSRQSVAKDSGRNPDGSVWAICPDCGHEFEAKHGTANSVNR